MKRLSARGAVKAMTLLEVLVVIAIIGIMFMLLQPARDIPTKALRIHCMSNLKQDAIGLIMFGTDHGDKFPWQTSTNSGGVEELSGSDSVLPSFQAVAGLMKNPNVFICPSDKQRKPAISWSNLGPTNVGYFLNADTIMTNRPAAAILSGDRNLAMHGKPLRPGPFLLTTNADLSWTPEIHKLGGNIGFADGHVEFIKTVRLGEIVRGQPASTNRLLIP